MLEVLTLASKLETEGKMIMFSEEKCQCGSVYPSNEDVILENFRFPSIALLELGKPLPQFLF